MKYILTLNEGLATGIEMMHVPPGSSVTAADQEITFHPDGYRTVRRPSMSSPPSMLMAMPRGGAAVQQGYIVPAAGSGGEGAQAQAAQQQQFSQRMLQQRLEEQSAQLQHSERQSRAGTQMQMQARGGEGGRAFNLDGTVADIPTATAILQGAQYDEK